MPVFFSNNLPTLLVISKTRSFSFVPYFPLVPGSLPPCPASRIIVSKSNLRGVKDKVLYINSKNIRKSLAETAYKIYKDKIKKIIAVTGTNGK